MRAEAFVLNYNGEALLTECLPSLVEACRHASITCDLTVIDNDSRDRSVEMLKRDFPGIRLRFSKNKVLCSFNDAVRESNADIVLLLNNDLKVEPDFVDPLIDVFQKNSDAFLAAPKATTFDGKRYEGCLSTMTFERGILRVESRFPGFETKIDTPGLTMQAGYGAYRRDRFLELGGFDDLYLPGTVEDSDLCFRAWKAGYAAYYAPQSRVYHHGQATFKKHFGPRRLLAMNQRNLHLFVWKNISDPFLWVQYLLWYWIRPFYFLLQGRAEFLWGAFWAFGRLGLAFKKRRLGRSGMRARSDREIFNISKGIS